MLQISYVVLCSTRIVYSLGVLYKIDQSRQVSLCYYTVMFVALSTVQCLSNCPRILHLAALDFQKNTLLFVRSDGGLGTAAAVTGRAESQTGIFGGGPIMGSSNSKRKSTTKAQHQLKTPSSTSDRQSASTTSLTNQARGKGATVLTFFRKQKQVH